MFKIDICAQLTRPRTAWRGKIEVGQDGQNNCCALMKEKPHTDWRWGIRTGWVGQKRYLCLIDKATYRLDMENWDATKYSDKISGFNDEITYPLEMVKKHAMGWSETRSAFNWQGYIPTINGDGKLGWDTGQKKGPRLMDRARTIWRRNLGWYN